jgi:hypothetical protein
MGGEHGYHEVSIDLCIRELYQRGSALVQAQHDDFHMWSRYKVGAAEAVHDRWFEPWPEQRRDKRPPWLTDEAHGGLALHHQVTVLRRTGRVCQAIDDGGSCVERDVGEDFVRPPRQNHFADIGMANPDQRLVGKPDGEQVCQAGILFDCYDVAAAMGESLGNEAAAGAQVEHQVTGADAGGGQQAIHEGATGEEIL